MKTLGAKEARNHFLSLLPDVEQKREELVGPGSDAFYGFYRGKLVIEGDILSPLFSDEELEEFFKRSAAQYN